MTCDQTQPLLDAFADRELGWGTAGRVRRHLAACPACAAELAETRCLDSRVRAWRDVPAPAGLQSRIAAALPSAPSLSAPYRPVTAHRVAVGFAGVAAASAACVWLLPGQPGRPTVAFAEVEQAMQKVKTISWKVEEQASDRPNHKSEDKSLTFTNWLRRDPPAIATTDFEMTPAHDFNLIKNLIDARGSFSLSKGECDVRPVLKVPVQERVERQIHSLTQFPQNVSLSEAKGQVQTTATNLHQAYVGVNGQRRVRFDRDVKTVWTMDDGHTTHRLAHVSIWADPGTHRIIRIEAHITEDTTGIRPFLTMIQDHFRYDQTPPKGTFDWSPPAGMKVIRMPAQVGKK